MQGLQGMGSSSEQFLRGSPKLGTAIGAPLGPLIRGKARKCYGHRGMGGSFEGQGTNDECPKQPTLAQTNPDWQIVPLAQGIQRAR